ncbi:MAG: hypothetical protein ACYC0X_26475 [Pirellulaceae bacterium]
MTGFATAEDGRTKSDDDFHWVGYRGAWAIHYAISREDLEAVPSWKLAEQESPPTSPRSAIKTANRLVDSLQGEVFGKRASECELEEVALQHLGGDKWIWVVRYGMEKQSRLPRIPSHEGTYEVTDVVVLMNGQVPRHWIERRTD